MAKKANTAAETQPATETPTNVNEQANVAPDANAANTAAETQPADDLVEVLIPIDYSNPDDINAYVAVNGVGMLVPKGQRVKIPRPYAELILNAEEERAKVTAKRRAEKKD